MRTSTESTALTSCGTVSYPAERIVCLTEETVETSKSRAKAALLRVRFSVAFPNCSPIIQHRSRASHVDQGRYCKPGAPDDRPGVAPAVAPVRSCHEFIPS